MRNRVAETAASIWDIDPSMRRPADRDKIRRIRLALRNTREGMQNAEQE